MKREREREAAHESGRGVGEADSQDGIKRANVDAELERSRRYNAEEVAAEHFAFDLASVLSGVARPIGHDARCHVVSTLERQVGPHLLDQNLANLTNLQAHSLEKSERSSRARERREDDVPWRT